jgi:glycosyltransferase involved in cell wall biosynthesis
MSVFVYANGIRCLSDIDFEYNKDKIVFVGNMRTLQNQDAVGFFIQDIFPLIKKQIRDIVFYVVGAEPPPFIQRLDDGKNIIVSGFVQSVEDMIKDAAVSVAPVRIAAGIQNKVLVSMACGIPVVLTSLIAESMPDLVPGENCVTADTVDDFVCSLIKIIQNKNIRNSIARRGYELVKAHYLWDEKLKGYEIV